MRIQKYGISLRKMERKDLEKVRAWRNAQHVRANFEFQELIREDQQIAWFNGLSNKLDYYFIIEVHNIGIGVVHLKEVNQKIKTAQSGVFIGKVEYLGTHFPALAVVLLMDFAFENLGLDYLLAKVKKGVRQVFQFNHSLGYELHKEDAEGFLLLKCSSQSYFNATSGLRKMLL